MIGAAALVIACAAQDAADEPVHIGGQPYERRATREATLALMLERLVPEPADWGEWYLLSPFPFDEKSGLDAVHPPERELASMAHGGPGPDLSATHAGKGGRELAWRSLGDATNRRVVLNDFEEPELNEWATAYLYTTVESERAQRIEVPFGSDDGVRVWLNGEVAHEVDWMRGMTAGEDTLVLDLLPGTNHVLFEVYQGVGGWEFQIDTREELAPRLDAELFYQLDRDFPPSRERRHYDVMSYPVPEEVVLEVGGIAFLGDGRPVVCTRRGDVYVVEDAYGEPPADARFHRFAGGLHEPLGLAVRRDPDGEALYTVQRGELTRLLDTDGDGTADWYHTFSDGWGVSGNYHEFAFGPKFDRRGNAWVTLNVGFCGSLGKSLARWRGWALKVTPEGETLPVCDGLRSPNGLGMWTDGEMFYVDNQGDYVATNRLNHLAPGSWAGHPASLRWREDVGPDERPPRQPPSVWFPYGEMGQSAADLALDETGGRFGPFEGQFFVGDQTLARVMRVFLEEVEGHYQGACFPFLEGLASGVNRLAFAPDGSLLVGQTDRGWGSVGRRRYGLERVVYRGELPFEILAVRAVEGGFELELTKVPERATAADAGSYRVTSYTYDYHADYGAPEKDERELSVSAVGAAPGERRIRLSCGPLRAGYVHEIAAEGLRDAETGEPLLHPVAYYTLVRVPGAAPAPKAASGPLPRVLFFTHSAGFVHEVVHRPRPEIFSHAEERLLEAAAGRFEVTATQDCAALAPDALERYDAVVFYTTGELPVPDGWREALVDWVRRGGAFAGVHSAADTFYEHPPYQAMLGGVFVEHPWDEEVTIAVDVPGHPAMAPFAGAGEFAIADEIYRFRGFRRWPAVALMHLVAAESDEHLARGGESASDYPLAWCKDYGAGRVFYTALGHRPDVWRDERFLEHLLGGVQWAIEGPRVPPARPPGAVVLQGGKPSELAGAELAESWRHVGGADPRWRATGGALEVAAGSGDLVSRESFGDSLVHVEFRIPEAPPGVTGQDRGNSGVYLHGRYEVQVLDSAGREPGPADCAAVYGLRAPDVDAARRAGRWQSYDVRFRAPRFDAGGAKTASARLSLWHNGVLVHDDVELPGPTPGGLGGAEAPLGPLLLQDHGAPVQYRNVWVAPLE